MTSPSQRDHCSPVKLITGLSVILLCLISTPSLVRSTSTHPFAWSEYVDFRHPAWRCAVGMVSSGIMSAR
jgi:hypothetical protein